MLLIAKMFMKFKDSERKKIKITLRQYYFFALWLPVIFSPIFLAYFVRDIKTNFFALATFGIIQYVVFALWSLFKYQGATAEELKKFSLSAPFSFVPFYAAGFILTYVLVNIDIPRLDVFAMALVLSLICVPVGKFYVLIANIIAKILEKIGFIEREFM